MESRKRESGIERERESERKTVANLSVKSLRNLLPESAFFANRLHEKLHNCRAIY